MLPLALAGLGLIKGNQERNQELQDRMLAAQTQLYSPWTKLQAQPVKRATGGLHRAAEGYLGGLDFGSDQAMKAAMAQQPNMYSKLQG